MLAEAGIIFDDTHIISVTARLEDPSVIHQALGAISKEYPLRGLPTVNNMTAHARSYLIGKCNLDLCF